jgi:anti-anti-sigma factor
MEVRVEKDGGFRRLEIKTEMTIQNARGLKSVLLENLLEASEMEVDLSGVVEMDSSGFQLLVMLGREAEALGNVFRVSSHSRATQAVMDLYRTSGL